MSPSLPACPDSDDVIPLQKHSAAADIASTLSEDQVPEAFLVMLLIQFSTMIIDRALYLRKAVLGKLIFQVGSIHLDQERGFCLCSVLNGSSRQSIFTLTVLVLSRAGDPGVWDPPVDVLHLASCH